MLILCYPESKNSSQHNQSKKAHRNGYASIAAHTRYSRIFPVELVGLGSISLANISFHNRIKKPKTHRYPSLKGTDPKFRRNHRHALHGTMKALVRIT